MSMSDRHFETTVARRTEGRKVLYNVCLILVSIVSPWINVVNVEGSTAWTAGCSAIKASTVPLKNKQSYLRPKPAVLQALSATPMSAVFASHVFVAAQSGAVFSTVAYFGWKAGKGFAAIQACLFCMFHGSRVHALARTKHFVWMPKRFATKITRSNASTFVSKLSMAVARTEYLYGIIAESVIVSTKIFTTVGAR